jgi:hypothetical protein
MYSPRHGPAIDFFQKAQAQNIDYVTKGQAQSTA